jgi:hypothetical protein
VVEQEIKKKKWIEAVATYSESNVNFRRNIKDLMNVNISSCVHDFDTHDDHTHVCNQLHTNYK